MLNLKELCRGLPLDPMTPNQGRDPNEPHAPVRTPNLTPEEERLALRNDLRYPPSSHNNILASEFAWELRQAYPIDQYPCRTRQAASIMLIIMNNLDPAVAQFPQELVTYVGNGQVFSIWAQVRTEHVSMMVLQYVGICV
eukprot:XP_013988386.1 PREDICTED: urocanate hydratase-like [Salmo salar]